MHKFTLFLFLLFLLFQSCEKLEKTNETSENNQSTEVETNKPKEVTEVSPPQKKESKPKLPKPPEIKPPPAPPKKPTPTKPEKAGFTPDLLAAVKNWSLIPASVFPLRSVTIKKDVQMNIYSQFGQPVGSSIVPSGREVIAIGHKGNLLTVSPSGKGTMRGTIAMDDTDFKEGVAYLFELRKRQRAALAKQKTKPIKPADPVVTTTSTPINKTKTTVSKTTSLFEDLPQPGDYGHGKFCICSDCRTKRLADTGSMR
jgi:hypothetical protein